MSDDVPMRPDGTLMGLESREEVDTWIKFLVGSTYDWVDALMVYNEGHLILRVRWADGEERAFHCKIERMMQLVLPPEKRESN